MNILGGTNSSKEETSTKIEHVINAQMEPAEEGHSAEEQSKVRTQTRMTSNQQLSEGEQYAAQHRGKKDNEVITKTHPSSQRSSSMCSIL